MRLRFSLGLLAALLLVPVGARAQNVCATAPLVTVRDINAIPAENLAQLDARGAALVAADVQSLLVGPLEGMVVRFRAVILSDPRVSGFATPTNGIPGRVHMFVRDVNAATQGVDGMTTQIVDGTGSNLVRDFFPGDVIDVCGRVSPFNAAGGLAKVMQISPLDNASITLADGVPPVAVDDPLRQPVVITTDDIHKTVAGAPEGANTQMRWLEFPRFNGQYVRFEGIQVVQGIPANTGRPNVLYQSVGQPTFINQYDISLRFRNDRAGTYANPPFRTRPANDPFIPPATGIANLQGFLVYQGFDGNFLFGAPRNAHFVVNPMEDADLEVLSAPPVAAAPSTPTDIVGTNAFTVMTTVVPGTASTTVVSVMLSVTVTPAAGGAAQTFTVPMTNTSGDAYSGTIPGQPDASFVTYAVVSTDNLGQSSTTASRTYRTSAGPVTAIEAIQRTPTGQPGPSPFAGVTTTRLNLNVVVQAVFTSGSARYAILQDDPNLAPWTGIWAVVTDFATPPAVGERLNITGARISESFSVTTLDQLAFTTTGTGSPYPYKVVPTNALAGNPGASEAHEGMMLRFEQVYITRVNADGPDDVPGNGEWSFATVGQPASAAVRADDLSSAFAPTGAPPVFYNLANFSVGQGRTFIQGAWWFSFGNFKLVPVVADDIGASFVSNEPVAGGAGTLRLRAAQPNPFAGTTRIPYEVATAGPVRLAVYDVTGREVAVLVDGDLAPSAYEATFDARALASGVYVVRLVAGGEALSGRLTVLR